MQFYNIFLVGIAFASAPIVNASVCTSFDDLFGNKEVGNCCWGGDDNFDACARQNGASACIGEDANFCRNNRVTPQQCGADCCDTTTGFGMACP